MQTGAAIPHVFEMTSDAFDEAFDQYVEDRHGAFLDNFDDWHRTHQAVGQRADEEDWDAIIEMARHLIDLLPGYVEPPDEEAT